MNFLAIALLNQKIVLSENGLKVRTVVLASGMVGTNGMVAR